MRSLARNLFLLIVAAFILNITPALAGKAPQFSLPGDSKKIQLKNYQGRVVYVDFWASWCVPCRRSFSWMNKMQSLHGDEKFSIIAINLDESHGAASEFLQKIPANFDIAYDPSGRTAEAYQLKAMPTSFLINKNGELVHQNIGFRSEDKTELEAKIKQLLGNGIVAKK